MSRDAGIAVLVGVVLLVGVVALGFGAFGTTYTTIESGPSTAIAGPPEDGSSGVVFELHKSGGLSILGLRLESREHFARIGVVVPAQCVLSDESGHETLSTDGICAALPVHGELSGGGTTSSGASLAFVDIKVQKKCFGALEVGASWPSTIDGCEE